MDTKGIPSEAYRQIKKAIFYLSKQIRLDGVILFGSQVAGKGHSESDIDLAVVSDDFERMTRSKLLDLLYQLHQHCSTRIEIHPYSLSQFKQARPTNFLGYILSHGKKII